MVERALRGVVQGMPDDQPPPDWADDQASLSEEEEEEEEEDEDYLDSDGTGIAVSDEDGLNFGIVERTARGRFATPTMSLSIELAEGFQAVTFVAAKVRTSDGGGSSFIAHYEGEAEPIQPGSEATVRVIFNPRFEGRFEAMIQLVFYDSQRSGRFVVERMVHAVAGSLADHSHFEPRTQESYTRPTGGGQYVPPGNIKLLWSGRPRKRQLPDYDLPPLVQEAIAMSNVDQPYEAHESRLISALRPNGLSMETYSQWFKALLNVEEGHQQRDLLDQVPFEVIIDESHGRYSVEIENKDEDLLPEVIVGDFLWLDDRQDDIRYEARITDVDVFKRGGFAVLKMRVQLPREFSLYHGALFMLRFRLNRITLRRQYHALASSFAPLRRLLFPSASDIKPVRQLPRSEIDSLPLVNQNIRGDAQQLQTVVSLLQHPKGSVPFIIYGPPGTGKTSTVVESMMQLLRRNAGTKILACTPSNAAADLLIERLSAAGLGIDELFRLNAYSRYQEDISEDVQAFSVPKENKEVRSYRVVLSTCSSAGFLEMMNIQAGHFSHIFLDEAAQAEEPLALIPIAAFANAQTTVVLAGDPNQLGPVIKAVNVSKAGLGRSYLQRLMRIRTVYGLDAHSGQTVVDLQRNRRSHGAIIAWPNRYLYEDIMRAHATAEISRYLLESNVLPKKGFPIVFHGIKGSEKRTKHSPSYFNVHEASLVRDYCQQLVSDRERKIYEEDIGVIAPYKAQVRTIRDLLKMARLEGITVGSVEQFQGQERKVIIVATTRSNDHVNATRALGFLRDRQRLNVAITRAQAMLIVIGDPGPLGQDMIWRTFLNYVCLRGGWKGKMLAWKPKDEVRVTGYETMPRPGGVVYGEEFIGGKSENIHRYQGDW
ncbi:P-loop containing nucleoside triphosphate hydrolase protein [Gloeopeniophorella convolvens]|nr:P-loop containing nucleoside triphosphate hydrolase protein [Gloeopeniophorella convolvens]